MIFGIDVRHIICRKYEEWKHFIKIKADLDSIRKETDDDVIRAKLKEAIAILDEIIEIKSDEMKETTSNFEEDFIKDIFENEDYYKMRINR